MEDLSVVVLHRESITTTLSTSSSDNKELGDSAIEEFVRALCPNLFGYNVFLEADLDLFLGKTLIA